MFDATLQIRGFDDELADALAAELVRQEEKVELIASENYASPRVLQAQGSVLTNKYAEGYPGKRYYGGCEHVDAIEQQQRLAVVALDAIRRHAELLGVAVPAPVHARGGALRVGDDLGEARARLLLGHVRPDALHEHGELRGDESGWAARRPR